jgi:hypothetical protein
LRSRGDGRPAGGFAPTGAKRGGLHQGLGTVQRASLPRRRASRIRRRRTCAAKSWVPGRPQGTGSARLFTHNDLIVRKTGAIVPSYAVTNGTHKRNKSSIDRGKMFQILSASSGACRTS